MDQYEWLHFESELNFMTCKLCVKHKKSNVKTGKVVAKAMTWSFSVSNVFNEKRKSHAAILCALDFKYPNLPMSEVQSMNRFHT